MEPQPTGHCDMTPAFEADGVTVKAPPAGNINSCITLTSALCPTTAGCEWIEDSTTPVDDKPVDDKPVDDKPVDDKPVTDKPNGYCKSKNMDTTAMKAAMTAPITDSAADMTVTAGSTDTGSMSVNADGSIGAMPDQHPCQGN
jgi:hypothetical protein